MFKKIAIALILSAYSMGFGFVMGFRFDAFFGEDIYRDTVYIGLDSTASNRFDPRLDIPSPPSPPPPVTIFAYFPLDDPRYPFIRALDSDFRNILSQVVSWRIRVESSGADSIVCSWDSTIVAGISPSRIEIGKTVRTGFPGSFFDCATNGRILVEPWEEFVVVYLRGATDRLTGLARIEFSLSPAGEVTVYAYNPIYPFDPLHTPFVIIPPGETRELELPPGDYIFLCVGDLPWITPSSMQVVGASFFRLSPGDTIELVTTRISPSYFPYEISGRIVDNSGEPIPYALIFAEGARINNPNSLTRIAIADSNGNFTIRDLNAQGVVVWAYQAGFVPRYFCGDIHWVTACTLYPAYNIRDITLELQRTDTSGIFGIFGKIVGPSGLSEPISGARIYAINPDLDTLSATISTYKGEFFLSRLREGTYSVCIDAYKYDSFCLNLPYPLSEETPFFNLGLVVLSRSTGIIAPEIVYQNEILKIYPNPFNDLVKIELLPGSSNYELSIFDITGRLVKRLKVSEEKYIGWDGTDNKNKPVPSGIYFINVDGNNHICGKVIFLR